MKQIQKYQFQRGKFDLILSYDADLLCVREQKDAAVLYVATDPDRPPRNRRFVAVHTGEFLEFGSTNYIGTAMTNGGAYVLHLFEVTNRKEPAR